MATPPPDRSVPPPAPRPTPAELAATAWPAVVWEVHSDVRRIVAAAAAQVVADDPAGAYLIVAGEALVQLRWAIPLRDPPRPPTGTACERHLAGMVAAHELLDQVGWAAAIAGLLSWGGAQLDRGHTPHRAGS